MNIDNTNILIYDIETIKGYFLISFYNPELDKYYNFSINQYINELDDLLKFYELNEDKYFIGFNNLNFDQQVIEYIIKNQDSLLQISSDKVTNSIWQFAQDIIEISNNGGFPPFREEYFTYKQIDLFKILHLDNKNKISGGSLKHMEYYMDMDIETFDFDHTQEILSEEECNKLIYYCNHDVKATYELYKIVRGDTNNNIYKEKDQIGLRLDISSEFNINCLNYSEAKIGDEIFKHAYCNEINIKIKDLPKKGYFRKEIQLKNCIPSYIKFKTPQLQTLLKKIKNTSLKFKDNFEETFTFYNTKYTLAQGGIHSTNTFECYKEDNDNFLEDEDVGLTYRLN